MMAWACQMAALFGSASVIRSFIRTSSMPPSTYMFSISVIEPYLVASVTWSRFYLIAISYPYQSSLPIIGLSGFIYAYMGFIAPYVNNKIRYNTIILIYISIGIFIPCMAVGVHIYCYVLGLLWGYLNAPLCQDK